MSQSIKSGKRELTRLKLRSLAASLEHWAGSAMLVVRKHNLVAWAGAAADLVYPRQCAACASEIDVDQGGIAICEGCRLAIAGLARPYCRRCGMSLPMESTLECRRCTDRRFRFASVSRLGTYERELRSYVLRMKHVGDEPLSRALGNFLGAICKLDNAPAKPDWVAPVPMFWRRRLRRQTSSAEILAATVGGHLGVKVYPRALTRIRNTQSQGELPPGERRANVRDAFRLRRSGPLSDARVLIVDDVLTTGATCNEVARVLRLAGVAEVRVAVVARTDGPLF